jgi:hypothetical protein
VKANQATGAHQPSGTPERRSRIGKEHQNKPADSSVEPIGDAIKCLRIALYEAHVGQPNLRNAIRGPTPPLRGRVQHHDLTFTPDKPCCEDGDVTSTRAQI